MSERESLQPLSVSQRAAMEEATANYQARLTGAAASLLVQRGLDEKTVAMFRVGVVGDPLPGHERFKGWLSIPYLDRNGEALSMRFRCIAEHNHRDFGHGKYMSMFEEPSRVFNIRAIHEAGDTLHICEGEFDAMVLTRIGLPSIAIPGASAWSNHHRRMIAGFSKVYVWGDPDQAGAEFVQRVCRASRAARGVRLRDGDVTDTFIAGGADALLALIEKEPTA